MDDATKAQVLIGKEAEDFVESELGKTILGMAKQDAERIMHDFDMVDVTNQPKVIELKIELRAVRRFEQYLSELIIKGREAWATRET